MSEFKKIPKKYHPKGYEILYEDRDIIVGNKTAGFLTVAALWNKDTREALFVRKLGSTKDVSYETYRPYFETRPPEVVANIIICLIHQTNYLLDQLLRRLEKGGLKENMFKARLARRDEQQRGGPDRS